MKANHNEGDPVDDQGFLVQTYKEHKNESKSQHIFWKAIHIWLVQTYKEHKNESKSQLY